MQIKTFLLTVSVPGDLSEKSIKELQLYLLSTSMSCYAVIEHGKDGTHRHLHAMWISTKPPQFKSFRAWKSRLFKQYVLPYHPDAKSKVAFVLTTCTNHKWYDSYLSKEHDHEELINSYDRALFDKYFPSPEEQKFLEERKSTPGPTPVHVTIAAEFNKAFPNATTVDYGDIQRLVHRLCIDGKLSFPDDKNYNAWCDHAYRYITNDDTPTPPQMKRAVTHWPVSTRPVFKRTTAPSQDGVQEEEDDPETPEEDS